ncbi:pseudouridine synthase [Candidatus Uabimicrobium amorphum]|uniref:tRNA pseudouridine synthase TruC n=1 Tax=Uabimicrobium amorphum TaxID=2596890 RepID=A0A5S9IJ29_UABAM|nr:pseudouridine synthase [Candidatus Uabimicrobium amorphum]BBM82763.1 tRNA pseudouridine synthase TruC [Candidatus Uabimicrobium amorphum]
MHIPILYQDESIVVVSKPPKLLVHRTDMAKDNIFLLQTLSQQIDKYLYPIHRLDRAASGAIAFALTKEDAKLLQESLQSTETRKEYIAFVRGSAPEEWTMERELTSEKGVKQHARTHFHKISEFFRCSLIRAQIFTGRKHQIRRHLAHSAHQILGDTSYGKGKINRFFRAEYGLPRLCLHAKWLEFKHPRHDKIVQINAPLADDFRSFLLRLPECDKEIVASL